MTRAEKVAEAQRLRGGGLLLREIAERMGVARTTVATWLEDPDLSKQRARRDRYRRPCENCGGPTDGSGGYKHQSRMCATCCAEQPHTLEIARAKSARAQHSQPRISEAELIQAVRVADSHGVQTCPEYRLRSAELGLPSATLILMRLGSWNRARELAGLSVHAPRHTYSRRWSHADLIQAIRRARSVLGGVPSIPAYERLRRERPELRLPSGSLVRVRMGTWVAALEAALVEEQVAA